jgi:hypothetical protein
LRIFAIRLAMGPLYALRAKHACPVSARKATAAIDAQLRSNRWLRLTVGPGTSGSARRSARRPPVACGVYRLAATEAKRINTIRIQISDQLVEMPWQIAQQLRGRLLAAGLYPLKITSLRRERARRSFSARPTRSRC